MFDISFSELLVIAVVALIVIGPEKLPKVARTLGALAGRMQRYMAQVKEEVNRDVRFQELQQLQQEIQETVTKTKDHLQNSLQENQDKIAYEVATLKSEVERPTADKTSPELAPKVKKVRTKRVPNKE
jgi:sec-independent protein translocase protein TatB